MKIYSKVVGQNSVPKNHEILFKIKKLLVGAIFEPEYAAYFTNNLFDAVKTVSNNTLVSYDFNDADKSVSFTFGENVTDFFADNFIRMGLGIVFSMVASNGRMCDILYLKDAEGYNLFNTKFIYGTDQYKSLDNSDLFSQKDLSCLFNINSFGNGRYVLSLIQ